LHKTPWETYSSHIYPSPLFSLTGGARPPLLPPLSAYGRAEHRGGGGPGSPAATTPAPRTDPRTSPRPPAPPDPLAPLERSRSPARNALAGGGPPWPTRTGTTGPPRLTQQAREHHGNPWSTQGPPAGSRDRRSTQLRGDPPRPRHGHGGALALRPHPARNGLKDRCYTTCDPLRPS